MSRQISEKGLALVKEFEGLSLDAYLCPANHWTIGFGRAHGVEPGDRITEAVAEKYLREDLDRFEGGVDLLLPGLNDAQFSALVSFAYNVGLGALEGSSLRRRIKAGEDPALVIQQELPRWVKGGDKELPGLVRRRAAEVSLALEGPQGGPEAPAQPEIPAEPSEPVSAPSVIALKQAARFHKGLAHQNAAWDALEAELTAEQLQAFAVAFRTAPKPPVKAGVIKLDAPYAYQLDSGTPQGFRMCFSSSCSMVIETLKPGALRGHSQADDFYLSVVNRFGDTTDASAQIKALEFFGIEAEFRMDGNFEDLEDQLRLGYPCPVGWLHKGSVNNPVGGGHWSTVVGMDLEQKRLIVHDPNGEAALVGGGYVSNAPTAGRFVEYSEKNFGPRWMVEGESTGWWIKVLSVN